MRKMGEYESTCWFDDQVSFMQELESARPMSQSQSHPYGSNYHHHHYVPSKQDLQLQYNIPHPHGHDAFLQLPQLESPRLPHSATSLSCNSIVPYAYDSNTSRSTLHSPSLTQEDNIPHSLYGNNDQVTDWRVLHKFVASQLSSQSQYQDASKETSYCDAGAVHVDEQITMVANESKRPEIGQQEYASTSTSSCQIDLWNWTFIYIAHMLIRWCILIIQHAF